MVIYNLGSINSDYFYHLPNLPLAGETLAAHEYQRGMGGKGANMSVAASRGAARVMHIGSVGQDGLWSKNRLLEYGVDTRHIASGSITGHAIIMIDPSGENSIIIYPGANREITKDQIGSALSEASSGDILLMQNETNQQIYTAKTAKELGLKVIYAAAPFEAKSVADILPYMDMLVLNEIEAKQLETSSGQDLQSLGPNHIFVTLGSRGCKHFDKLQDKTLHFDAIPVKAVDTTGAGDTFTGYLAAGLDRGLGVEQSIMLATRAAALMVMRHGTSDVIPDLKDIEDKFGPQPI
jgi:ribokinase